MRRLFGLLLVLTAATIDAHAVDPNNANLSVCPNTLEKFSGLPSGWSFPAPEYARMIEATPELADYFGGFARMAHFLDDPANIEFFDLLGAYVGLGFESEAMKSIGGDEFAHRVVQVQQVTDIAAALGIHSSRRDDFETAFIALALGNLPEQAAVDLAELDQRDLRPSYQGFAERRSAQLPSLKKMVWHSTMAQGAVIHFLGSYGGATPNVSDELSLLRGRFTGHPGRETLQQQRLLDAIEIQLDHDVKRVVRMGLVPKFARESVRRDMTKTDRLLVEGAFTMFFSKVLTNVKRIEDPSERRDLTSPLVLMSRFEKSLQDDVFVDQGLTPIYRRALVEVLLRQTTLSGREMRQRLRSQLDAHLRDLHAQWRAVDRPVVPAKADANFVRPTREHRLAAYAEQVRARALAPVRPKRRASRKDEEALAAKSTVPDVWADLVDRSRSLAEARAHFGKVVSADRPMILEIERSGFRYKLEFAPRLIEQLLDPAAHEPQDLRDWIEALRLGAEKGWRKFAGREDGGYDWEIKLPKTPFRMLGYKTGGGVWRFGSIRALH